MASRFLLVKHLSLGYGVLLRREQNDIGQIYFADAKCKKSVILSHPSMSVADNLSLTKFTLLGLYEGLFDDATKQKGLEYTSSQVKNMHVSENECYGSIVGSHEYTFRITVDSNSFITLSCTCQTEGACKHLYAVFVSMRKLLDPRGATHLQSENSDGNEFRELIERFLYVRGGDNIPLIGKTTYLIRNIEKCQQFIETLHSFYARAQYKARAISDILAPLFFNEKNVESFNKLKELLSPEIATMLNEGEKYYQETLLRDYERKAGPAKKSNLYHILLTPDCDGLVTLLHHAEDNYEEERLASQVMMEYIKYQDLTIENIIALKKCFIFQVNHRYYMNDLQRSPAQNSLSAYLLFFDELPLNERKIKNIPLEYFLRVATFCDDKSHYIQIAYDYFDQLKEEDIPLLAELLVGVSLQHHFIDERTIRLSIELSKRIPSGKYINALVESNIRSPKKSRTA